MIIIMNDDDTISALTYMGIDPWERSSSCLKSLGRKGWLKCSTYWSIHVLSMNKIYIMKKISLNVKV